MVRPNSQTGGKQRSPHDFIHVHGAQAVKQNAAQAARIDGRSDGRYADGRNGGKAKSGEQGIERQGQADFIQHLQRGHAHSGGGLKHCRVHPAQTGKKIAQQHILVVEDENNDRRGLSQAGGGNENGEQRQAGNGVNHGKEVHQKGGPDF